MEKEQKRLQIENEKQEKKRKQEEAARLAQEAREQQKREKEEREEAARQVKEKQKLTNFFANPGSAAKQTVSGLSSAQKQHLANGHNKNLIGGNQITNDVRQARLPDQTPNSQDSDHEIFKSYSVLTEAHQIQRAFRMRFGEAYVKPRPEFTKDLLVRSMKIYNDWHKSLL